MIKVYLVFFKTQTRILLLVYSKMLSFCSYKILMYFFRNYVKICFYRQLNLTLGDQKPRDQQ